MKRLFIIFLGVIAFVYYSNQHSLSFLQKYLNVTETSFSPSLRGTTSTSRETVQTQAPPPSTPENTKAVTPKSTTTATPNAPVVAPTTPTPTATANTPATVTTTNGKYTPTTIDSYRVTVENGKLVVTGKPTDYGKYYGADGIIVDIQEARANVKSTQVVPFTGGRVRYEYPLHYSVGDVILNLDEHYPNKTDDPNMVLGSAEYHLTDGDPYLLPSYMVQSSDPQIIALANTLTQGKQTNGAKAQAIFYWVANHVSYDTAQANNPDPPFYSALQTYQNRIALCTGYAHLNASLLRAIGIEAKVVYGENHAWNEVNLNGVWQTEDPTYGSGFIDKRTGKFVHQYQPAYLTKSDMHKTGEYPW